MNNSKTHFSMLAAGAALAGLAVLAAGNAQANMVQNGDFSANAAQFVSYPGYSAYGNGANGIGGWRGPGNVGLNGLDTGFYASQGAPFAPASMTGVRDFLFLQNTNTSASQTVTTSASQQYTLTYDAAMRNGEAGGDSMEVILTDGTSNTQIVTETPAITDTGFNTFTLNFTAPSTATAIEFLNNSTNFTNGTVDVSNVSLAATAVPAPTTLSLFALGGAALVLVGRKRKA